MPWDKEANLKMINKIPIHAKSAGSCWPRIKDVRILKVASSIKGIKGYTHEKKRSINWEVVLESGIMLVNFKWNDEGSLLCFCSSIWIGSTSAVNRLDHKLVTNLSLPIKASQDKGLFSLLEKFMME